MSNLKLLHGDCYKLIKDIPDKSIDLVYIDIPYLMAEGGHGKSAISQRMKNKRHQIREIINGIDYTILNDLTRVLKHIYIYIWCSKNQLLDILKWGVEEKHCLFEILVWCKTNPSPTGNNMYLPDIEYCIMFREPSTTKLNDGYELKSRWHISPINKADKDLYKHPTIKPLELVKRHILHSTKEGDTVLDCFMGSGTTGVACKELNRNFIGMELNDEYYDIAVKRVNGITAQGQLSIFTDTEKMEQGSLFDEV